MKSNRFNRLLRGSSLLASVFGRSAFHPATFAIVFGVVGVLSILGDPARHGGQFFVWVGIVIVATLLAWLAFTLCGTVIGRLRMGWPRILLTFVAFGLTGAIRGGLLGVFGMATSVAPEVNWQFRLGNGALIGFALLPIASKLVSDYIAFHLNFRELTSKQSELTDRVSNSNAELNAERVELVGAITQHLSSAVEQVAADAQPGQTIDAYGALVAQLLQLSDTVVRPLSRELAKQSPALGSTKHVHQVPVRSARTLVEAATLTRPFRPLPVMVIWAIIGASTMIALRPGFPEILAYPLFVGSTGAILYLGKRFIQPILSSMSIVPRLFLIGATFVVASTASAALSWLPLANTTRQGFSALEATLLVLDPIATFIMCLVLALLSGIQSERLRVLDELQRTNDQLNWQITRTRGMLRAQRLELSRNVHGGVQSVILAAAFKLRAAIASGTVDAPTLDSLKSDLASIASFSAAAKQYPGIDAAFTELRTLWGAELTLVTTVDDSARQATEGDDVLRANLIDVCVEAVTNAVKHGKATRVEISLTAKDNLVHVKVWNDGKPIREGSLAGQGLGLCAEVGTAASLSNQDNGVTLSVDIPLQTTTSVETGSR